MDINQLIAENTTEGVELPEGINAPIPIERPDFDQIVEEEQLMQSRIEKAVSLFGNVDPFVKIGAESDVAIFARDTSSANGIGHTRDELNTSTTSLGVRATDFGLRSSGGLGGDFINVNVEGDEDFIVDVLAHELSHQGRGVALREDPEASDFLFELVAGDRKSKGDGEHLDIAFRRDQISTGKNGTASRGDIDNIGRRVHFDRAVTTQQGPEMGGEFIDFFEKLLERRN